MQFLPLRDDQQELPSRFEPVQSFVAACLVGIDAAVDAMTKRVGIPFENHLPRFVERAREPSEPSNKSPHETWRNDRLVETRFVLPGVILPGVGVVLLDGITDLTSVMQDGFSIGGLGLVQKRRGYVDQARSGETLIGQDESRDNR